MAGETWCGSVLSLRKEEARPFALAWALMVNVGKDGNKSTPQASGINTYALAWRGLSIESVSHDIFSRADGAYLCGNQFPPPRMAAMTNRCAPRES
jgi:hypothetical protein